MSVAFPALVAGFLWVAVILSSSARPAFAQAARTVAGSVVLRGPAVPIRITLRSPSRSSNRIVFADGAGAFAISGVAVGEYEILIEADGYRPLREYLDVPQGTGPYPVQFMLQQIPSAPTPGSRESVPVAALQVPAGARNELDKGMREMRDGRPDAARKHFEKALEEHPKFPQALHAVALLDAGTSQPERALSNLEKAIAIQPSYAEAYVTLSRVLNLLGRHDEALTAGNKAVQLRKDLWQAQYEIGVACLSLGRPDAAQEAAGKIEALAGPNTPELRLLRSGILLKASRLTEARAELELFLQAAPTHPQSDLARRTLKLIDEAHPRSGPSTPPR